MLDIKTELSAHLRFKERLLADYPAIDEETLHDTLEGLSSLEDMLVATLRQSHKDECMAEMLEKMIGELSARAKRHSDRSVKAREMVAAAMEEAGLKRLLAPDMTVSLRPTQPKVIVVDEAQIPEDYWKPQPPKLDKTLIKKALSDKYEVPGATLSNGGQTLQVRHG